MPDLTLSVAYKPVSPKLVQRVIWVWGIVGFLLLLVAIKTFALWHFGDFYPSKLWGLGIVLFLAGGLGFIYVPFLLKTLELEGRRLVGNEDGLVLPPPWLGLGASRPVVWAAIQAIDFIENERGGRKKLVLKTDTDIQSLAIDGLSNEDLLTLLLALDIRAANAQWTSRAAAFRDQLNNERLGLEANSFTQVWEEELRRRFSATTFVPHAPGSKLRDGTLTIKRQLAFGGFSAVYLADDDHGNQVVVKECAVPLDSEDAANRKSVELFQREATILSKLQHPQIARVFDHFQESGRTYLVLQYVAGQNLRELVRHSGARKEAQALELAKQMAHILDYLHSREPAIVHRDFTPDNLVLSGGRLTLVDFGAANEFASRATGTLIGKQCYMSPEQMRGKAVPQTDLYALGCTLYFILTGEDPTPLSVLTVNGESVCGNTNEILRRLTMQEPGDRMSSAKELLSALAGEAGGFTIKLAESAAQPVEQRSDQQQAGEHR